MSLSFISLGLLLVPETIEIIDGGEIIVDLEPDSEIACEVDNN